MKTFHLCALAFLLLAFSPAGARTITWGSSVGDLLVDSSGTALDDSFKFELGSFGSFVPTESNMELWEANWKPFDTATVLDGGWNPAEPFFSGSANLNMDGTTSNTPFLSPVFAEGEQGYLWVYNTRTMAYNFTEWALITNTSADGNLLDDWTFPAPSDQTGLPLQWRLSNATSVPYGGLNTVQGPGDYTADPPGFDLQTHSVIPEPSPALLVLLAATALTASRRRRLLGA